MRPSLLLAYSVNHNAPSGPATIPIGWLTCVGIAHSLMVPSVRILPMRLPLSSVNHNALSGPATIAYGALPALGNAYSRKRDGALTLIASLALWPKRSTNENVHEPGAIGVMVTLNFGPMP